MTEADTFKRLTARTYSPYGAHSSSGHPLLGFTGQPVDRVSGCYHLGNGRRAYNPVLMRFQSADTVSPFGRGGINSYAYCGADPVNRTDPSGRSWSNVAHVLFGVSGALGVAGRIVNRARVRIDRVPLAQGIEDPPISNLHLRVNQFADAMDFAGYSASVSVRPFNVTRGDGTTLVNAAASTLLGVDVGRAAAHITGYAPLPFNAVREWNRAGLRDMHRGQVIAGAIYDATGLSLVVDALTTTANAVGTVVSGVVAGVARRLRQGSRQGSDMEMQSR